MTPYEIDILLHYYARCEDHGDVERKPPIWPSTLLYFLEQELLATANAEAQAHYAITDRGRAYVEALQRVPLPVQVWVMPSEESR